MSTIVEATVPADQFALAETFAREPDAEFRMVRLVAHGLDRVMPFLWADHDDTDRLQRAVRRDESVRDVDSLAEVDGECLLQIQWGPSAHVLVSILGEIDASIIDASGCDGSWHFQIYLPDNEHVSSIYEFSDVYGIDLSVDQVNHLSGTSAYGYLGLTQRQYETLVSAYDSGYYDVPRVINQAELAADFEVSHQALSERLRRAHRTVITNALYHKIHRRDHTVSPQMRREADT